MTPQKTLRTVVKESYQNSIGDWMTNIRNNPQINIDPERIIELWHNHKDSEFVNIMEKFLRANNIDFSWY